jgi:hypothetical protein
VSDAEGLLSPIKTHFSTVIASAEKNEHLNCSKDNLIINNQINTIKI